MKVLLTGRNGQVGWEVEKLLGTVGEVIALDKSTLDLADPDAIRRVVRETRPDCIVNAAAYTAVDKAEAEREAAMAINALAPAVLAEEAKKLGALLIHFSTDYVFDGQKAAPYVEDDTPNPLSVYGRSKLEGERAILATGGRALVLRTSWVYAPRGRNFFLAIARKARAGESLRVVSDQAGVPNSAAFLAETVLRVVKRAERNLDSPQLYHLSATGRTTWYDFAVEIVRGLGLNVPVAPIQTQDYPAAAVRPRSAVLDSTRISRDLDLPMPAWQDLLTELLKQEGER